MSTNRPSAPLDPGRWGRRDVYWITHITVETGHHEFRVGATGAGVPRPCSAKRANASTTQARLRDHCRADATRQLQTKERRLELPTRIESGTSPASVHGATTKKNAGSRTAMVRCTCSRRSLRAHSNLPFMVSRRRPGADTLAMLSQSGNRARLKPECHGSNEARPEK